MPKTAPSARMREVITAFLNTPTSAESAGEAVTQLVQPAARRVVPEEFEQEETDFIGRDRYARPSGPGQA